MEAIANRPPIAFIFMQWILDEKESYLPLLQLLDEFAFSSVALLLF
jgi:hypothetical protein